MKRLISTMVLTGGIALAGIAAAPAAYADVTNPADNPYPITVTGDDGLTYTDGQDTLPGYDDAACTYIPGAWFDFANNRVRYADGQSIPWTEWDRASGYDAWKAKQTAAAPVPAPAPAAPAAGTTSGGGTSKPSGTSANTESAVLAAGASADPSASPSASPSAEASEEAEPTAATASPSEQAEIVAADAPGGTGSAGSTSTAGLAILGALFGIGGLAFGGYTFLRRGAGRSPA